MRALSSGCDLGSCVQCFPGAQIQKSPPRRGRPAGQPAFDESCLLRAEAGAGVFARQQDKLRDVDDQKKAFPEDASGVFQPKQAVGNASGGLGDEEGAQPEHAPHQRGQDQKDVRGMPHIPVGKKPSAEELSIKYQPICREFGKHKRAHRGRQEIRLLSGLAVGDWPWQTALNRRAPPPDIIPRIKSLWVWRRVRPYRAHGRAFGQISLESRQVRPSVVGPCIVALAIL